MNLGMSAVEFLRFPIMKAHVDDYMDFPEESQAVVREALSRGKGVIFMTSHMANWELAAMRIIHAGFELHAVYTPQRNDGGIETIISDIRQNVTGMHIIDNHRGLREIFKVLKAGGIVVIMQDLDARKDGVITKFFGLDASTHDGIIRLYNKFKCPVIAVQIIRDKKDFTHHKIIFKEIISDRPGFGKDVKASLEICNGVIQDWIKEAPGQWMWIMDRWEYTLGKKI